MHYHRLKFMSLVAALVLAVTAPQSQGRRLPGQAEASEHLKVFVEVLSYVETNFVEEIDTQVAIYSAIRGLLKALDPTSYFIPPDAYKELQESPAQGTAGVGLEITTRDDMLTVVAPIEGSPAFRAGIRPGDQIITVDGASTKNMTLIEAVKKLRGPEGTLVTISILRTGFPTPKAFTLPRAIMAIKSVRWQRLPDDIGYVKLHRFSETTSAELEDALQDLSEQHIRALVLDLRDNPGGLLEQAIAVADQFLDGGQLIVYTRGRVANQNMKGFSTKPQALWTYPLIVLVNKGSAAGAEIVAGALQDLKRARLLGTPTSGRGLIQTLMPLSDGSALRLTTARFFTPHGRSIEGKGLTPDIVVEPPTLEPRSFGDLNTDIELQRAVKLLRAQKQHRR